MKCRRGREQAGAGCGRGMAPAAVTSRHCRAASAHTFLRRLRALPSDMSVSPTDMADDRLLKSSPADDRLLVSSPFSGLKSGKVSQELALAGASGFGGRRSDCMDCVNCAGDGCPSARDFFRSRAETGVRSTDELPLRGVAGFADSEVASSAVGEVVDESSMLLAALAAFAAALSRVRAEAARARDESALLGPLVPFAAPASDVSASACADCRQPIAALRGRRAGVGLPHHFPLSESWLQSRTRGVTSMCPNLF